MELPSHPETEEAPSKQHPAGTVNWATVVVVAVVGALFAVIVVLHLTGVVGPGAQ